MTILDLFAGLKAKGYDNHTAEGFAAMAEMWADNSNPEIRHPHEVSIGKLRNVLELDRRNVFRCWYGEAEPPACEWKGMLILAQDAYRHGVIDHCIDFILQNP